MYVFVPVRRLTSLSTSMPPGRHRLSGWSDDVSCREKRLRFRRSCQSQDPPRVSLSSIDAPTGDDAGTRKKKDRIGLEEQGQPHEVKPIESNDLIDKGPVKRKRLPSEERLRNEIVYQLRESLRSSQEKMNKQELTLAEQQRWTQVHTYTAQVYNTILKDQQLQEWERRLKEIEKKRLTG
jgi:hypothetical protein